MKMIFRNKPLYLFLLCLFFVFHGYVENFNYIPVKDASLLLAVYIAATAVLLGIFFLIYRKLSKAALMSFVFMGFFFFYGAIYDRIMHMAPGSFLSKYSTQLGGFLLVSIVLFVFLFRYKKSMHRFNYVMNVFLTLLIFLDLCWLGYRVVNGKTYNDNALLKQVTVCDSCDRPDIYLLLADEYAGDQALRETMNFDNSEFKSELAKRGFHSPVSSSNYNFTQFSIASMLNMNYLQDIEGSNRSHSDLTRCVSQIRRNNVYKVLERHGYELFNYSIFDVYDQPSMMKSSVLPERTRFITAQTLFARLDENIIFNMARKFGQKMQRRRLMLAHNSNVRVLDSLKGLISRQTARPKFVYTHLEMPHYPYFFDKEGNFRNYMDIALTDETNIPNYVGYLQYTNKLLLQLIDDIRARSAKPPIIILASDHGFREYAVKVDRKYRFMNIVSVYLPDQNYSGFYNGMSNVNLFRILFNKQFGQKLPLLKDSTSYVRP